MNSSISWDDKADVISELQNYDISISHFAPVRSVIQALKTANLFYDDLENAFKPQTFVTGKKKTIVKDQTTGREKTTVEDITTTGVRHAIIAQAFSRTIRGLLVE